MYHTMSQFALHTELVLILHWLVLMNVSNDSNMHCLHVPPLTRAVSLCPNKEARAFCIGLVNTSRKSIKHASVCQHSELITYFSILLVN